MEGERHVKLGQTDAKAAARAKTTPEESPYRPDTHAVVIGINRYQDPAIRDLQYARADAEAIHAVLTDPELGRFDPDNVTLLLDEKATQRKIRSAIGTKLPRRVGERSTVCIYYAGHGAPVVNPGTRSQDGLEKYLIPHDAELDDLRASGIAMEEIQKFFGWLSASQVLFFIDSCYSGGAGGRTFQHPDFQARASLTDEFLEHLGSEGRFVVTACGLNEVSLETPEVGHGLFTHYLVEGLQGKADTDKDGLVTIDELYTYVYRNVEGHARKMGGSMHPIRKGFVSGTVYLTQYETEAQKRARELDDEAQALYEADNLDEACRLWEEVLEIAPEHERARQRLAEVTERRLAEQRQREEAERKRQRILERKRRVLLRHYQEKTLPLAEYTRGMALLEKSPDALTEAEAAIRQFLDPFTDEQITVSIYLQSIRLLTTEAEPEEKIEAAPPTPRKEPKTQGQEPIREERESAEKAQQEEVSVTSGVLSGTETPAPVAEPEPRDEPIPMSSQDASSAGVTQTTKPSPPETWTNDLGMEFLLIPAGTFEMGSTDGRSDEQPVHTVTISKPFFLGKHEVTQGQWKAVMGTEPWRGKVSLKTGVKEGDDYPAVYVSWEDAQAFIGKLNSQDIRNRYRLPTEAEWEYAARAGSTTEYGFSDDAIRLDDYAWYKANACDVGEKYAHRVGQKRPNAWGLYDMHGNVWEWVQDWYGSYSSEAVTDPVGPESGSLRVMRGGCWDATAEYARSADRGRIRPGDRDYALGFRLVRMGL